MLLAGAIGLALQSTAIAAQNDAVLKTEYTIKAYKNCQLVHQQSMTAEQVNAYEALKEQEEKMHSFEMNLDGVEEVLNQYTDEIAELSDLAIQETENTVFIDKHYLEKQEEVAQRLDEFMEEHEHKFDALEEQGEIIEEFADKFTYAIEKDLEGIDYNNIQIGKYGEDTDKQTCFAHSGITIL